jgi:hypothetical protein
MERNQYAQDQPNLLNFLNETKVGNSNRNTSNILNLMDRSYLFRKDVGKTPADSDDNDCNDEWVGSNKHRIDADVPFDDHIRIQITNRDQLNVGYLNEEG